MTSRDEDAVRALLTLKLCGNDAMKYFQRQKPAGWIISNIILIISTQQLSWSLMKCKPIIRTARCRFTVAGGIFNSANVISGLSLLRNVGHLMQQK